VLSLSHIQDLVDIIIVVLVIISHPIVQLMRQHKLNINVYENGAAKKKKKNTKWNENKRTYGN